MLTLAAGSVAQDCNGRSRRDFLRAGALGLGGLTLPWLLGVKARAAAAGVDYVHDRSVVLIFLAGGASHIETFNPNLDAPDPYRSVTGEVKTTIPGVTLGGTFPLLANHAKKMAIVRSFRHPVANHEQAISHVLTGGTDPDGKGKSGHGLGALYARLRGANHERTGMPTYALLTAPHPDGQYARELDRVVFGSRAGPLGPTCEPFTPAGNGTAVANLQLRLPAGRLEDRLALLEQLDAVKRGLDAVEGHDPLTRRAVELLTGGAGRAFDWNQEKPAVRERYDTGMFRCGHKVKEPSILGRQLLTARRLVEAGAGFVTVQSAGWDMHADGNNPGIKEGMEMLGRPLDRALSAFLEDLDQRGLSDKVLVLLTGDFGRTPKINARGGRDHWANLCTLALWGGGLKTGQVLGKSDRTNGTPAGDPVTPANLMATVMHCLFDIGKLRVARGAPPELVRQIESANPIHGLL